VSSTTKVLTDFEKFRSEAARDDFAYVVPDFRLNKAFDKLNTLSAPQKDKVEFTGSYCKGFNLPEPLPKLRQPGYTERFAVGWWLFRQRGYLSCR